MGHDTTSLTLASSGARAIRQDARPGPATALTVLSHLWRDLERPPTVRDLAVRLSTTPSQAHRFLKELERAGHVVYVGRAAAPVQLAARLRAAMAGDDAAA